MALTDTLPTNGNGDLVIANPANASLSNCGPGSVTANSGATAVSISGATLPAGSGSVCTI
jgi:hypothetical protein